MPWHLPTINNLQPTRSLLANFQQKKEKVVGCRRWRPGFSYVEILLSMFLILAFIAILLTTSTVYIHSRRTNLQTMATKMASCEVERLRKLPFSQLPTLDGQFDATCTADLSKLPAGTTLRLIAGYGSPANPKIKQITTAVNWTEKGLAQQIKLETLISENGL